MAVERSDNVLIVVEGLEAAKAFFLELGLESEGQAPVEAHGWTVSSGSRASGATSR